MKSCQCNCRPEPFYGLEPQFQPQPNSCQYPLINYLAAQLNNNPQNPGFLGLESSSTYHNPEDLVQFVISGLLAKGLKKGLFFAPDPYVKFKIGPGYSDQNSVFLPHHGQNCRTTVVENNIEPKWPEQVTLFKVVLITESFPSS